MEGMTTIIPAAELMQIHVGQSEGGTLVLLHVGGTGSFLTPAEAREIAEALEDAADAVEAELGF